MSLSQLLSHFSSEISVELVASASTERTNAVIVLKIDSSWTSN